MEKHRCKLCYRRFSNGRALGGHMRSHMMNLPVVPQKPSFESSLSSSESESDSEPEEGEIVIKGKLVCRLRGEKQPTRSSVKLADRDSSEFLLLSGSSSVTLQDRESETESSKNVTRRRSKRTRKPVSAIVNYHHHHSRNHYDYSKLLLDDIDNYYNNVDVDQQQQPGGSSVSEVTSEEDVAFCLMMMSRDKWSDNGHGHRHGHEENGDFSYNNNVEDDEGYDGVDNDKIAPVVRKNYKCDTCNKVFRSYQALGGHRASHKKLRVSMSESVPGRGNSKSSHHNVVAAAAVVNEEEKKIHECPICLRVFASGQALGGHKRSHVVGNGGIIIDNKINNNNIVKSEVFVHQIAKKKKLVVEGLIDLNLPAPVEDEDEEIISQIATSAVSDVHL